MSPNTILVTHTGSLPRRADLSVALGELDLSQPVSAELERVIAANTRDVVKAQLDVGIDIVNDGEQGRVGFQTYIPSRMTGFGGVTSRRMLRDLANFPDFAAMMMKQMAADGPMRRPLPAAIAPVSYINNSAVRAEGDRFDAILRDLGAANHRRFRTAPSPGIVATTMHNQYYDTFDRYLDVLADELHKEYRGIVDAGHTLQIDAPDLAMESGMFYADLNTTDFVKAVERHIEAINRAIGDIPREKVRLHVCWGNGNAPHSDDVELHHLLPVLKQANVDALGIPFGNPRHEHEIGLLKGALPPHMKVLAGVIDSTSNYLEHPGVVAQRLKAAVYALGDVERVQGSSDCGFGTFVGMEMVARDVVWAKLHALKQGAELAARAL